MKRQSLAIIGGIAGFLLICALLPWAEQAASDPNIETYGQALWYGIVTLTTVGYGDYFPKSTRGQLISLVFVLGSLGVLGLLIGRIGEAISTYRERRRLGHHGVDFSGHIVVLGWHETTQLIIDEARAADRPIVIVTDDKSEIEEMHEAYPDADVFPLYSKYEDYEKLRRVNIEDSYRVLMSLQSDTDMLIALLNLKREFPSLDFVVSLQNLEFEGTFRGAGVAAAMSTDHIASRLIASLIYEPDVAEFNKDLIQAADEGDDSEYDVQQFYVGEGSDYAGREWGDLFDEFYGDLGALPVALAKKSEGDHEVREIPGDDAVVEAGDYVLLILQGAVAGDVESRFGVAQGAVD